MARVVREVREIICFLGQHELIHEFDLFLLRYTITFHVSMLDTVKTHFQETKIFKQPFDGSYLGGIIYHKGSLVL